MVVLPLLIYGENTPKKIPLTYRVKLFTIEKKEIRGFLYLVTDSSIILSNKRNRPISFDTIPFYRINKLHITTPGSGGLGFIAGGAVSLATGLVVGSFISNGEEAVSAVITGFLLSFPAALIGMTIAKNCGKYIHINGDYKQFQYWKNQLSEKAYLNQLHLTP